MTTVKEPLHGPGSPSFFQSVISRLKSPVAPVSSAAQHKLSRSTLGANGAADGGLEGPRCQFTYSDGRRCGHERASLCVHHASKQRESAAKDVPDAALDAPELVALCADLTTATHINRALAHVFLLLAQGRIPQKQAVAFGYLSQLLLQTVPGIRSEFVSCHGYPYWEEKLKASLEQKEDNEDEDPSPAGGKNNGTPGKGQPSREVVERGATASGPTNQVTTSGPFPSDNPAPAEKAHLSPESLGEGLTPADWGSLYYRSLDLLAGKYSVTPEGRREGSLLNTELELLNPPAAKTPKGARAAIIEHMKSGMAQHQAHYHKNDRSRFPSVNFYGHPIQPAVHWDEPNQRAAAPASRAEAGDPPHAVILSDPRERSISPGSLSPVPALSPVPTPSPQNPPSPARVPGPREWPRPLTPEDRAWARAFSGPDAAPDLPPPGLDWFPPDPNSAPPGQPGEPGKKDPLNRKGHTTEWFVPACWSAKRPPDPCPSRAEKRARELRGMSNSKFRRLQHQNSRPF